MAVKNSGDLFHFPPSVPANSSGKNRLHCRPKAAFSPGHDALPQAIRLRRRQPQRGRGGSTLWAFSPVPWLWVHKDRQVACAFFLRRARQRRSSVLREKSEKVAHGRAPQSMTL